MSRWHDSLTQTTYLVPDEAVSSIQKHLTSRLIEYLNAHEERQSGRSPHRTGLTAAADGLALFWQEQYPQLIFPLRVTSNRQHPERAFQLTAWEREDDGSYVVQGPWRSKYLGPGSPPLLPASALGVNAPEHLLASDWVLAAAAFAVSAYWSSGARHPENQDVTDEALGALRLGILLLPLWEAVSVSPGPLAEFVRLRPVRETVQALKGEFGSNLPTESREIIEALRSTRPPAWTREHVVHLLVGQAVRIKQYVFETPRLPQIRGASILLERVVGAAAEELGATYSPECVLRKAGGSLLALLPTPDSGTARDWEARVTSIAYRLTGTARFAAASSAVPIAHLLPSAVDHEFHRHVGKAYDILERVREQADEPLWETLPFEARCDICGDRPAEFARILYSGEGSVSLCRVCAQRHEVGRRERQKLTKQAWEDFGLDPLDWIAPASDDDTQTVSVAASLVDLAPSDRRRRWLAMVYGDGNNFGAIVQRLKGPAEQLHWTRRLYWTVRGLTHVALVGATVHFAKANTSSDKPRAAEADERVAYSAVPFELLTIGGDDVAFFAWAPVGLKAVERLQAALEHEFSPLSAQSGNVTSDLPPVTFSFGIAAGDEHIPVRRLRDVAEDVLLKHVKGEAPLGAPRGRIAFFVANNASDMTPLRAKKAWRPEHQSKARRVVLSLQPLTSEQLAFLLHKAHDLRSEVGRLSRLATAFLKADPSVAALHYRYVRARAAARSEGQAGDTTDPFFTALERDTAGHSWTLFAPEGAAALPLLPSSATSDGSNGSRPIFRMPLLDLLQLVKAMQ